jgi:hypothetical protein
MKRRYDTVSVLEGSEGPFVPYLAMARIFRDLPQGTSFAAGQEEVKSELGKLEQLPAKVYDLRGRIAVYVSQGQDKGYAKLVIEPDSLEDKLGIEVKKEIKVKDFEELVKEIEKIVV